MRRLVGVLAVLLVALAAAPAALAAAPSVAEVRGPADDLLSSAGPGPFAYPDVVGSGVRVGDATADDRGVELYDVSLLGGRVWAYRVYVPTKGLRGAAIDSLVIGGREVSVTANKVVHLAPKTYVVLLQQAYVPGRRGRNEGTVGIRAYVGDPGFGVTPGTQLLVGLARPPVQRPPKGVAGSAVVLGVDPARLAANMPLAVASPFQLRALQPSVGSRAVALALQHLGVPYVWGGADPSGFDCSGLVMYVYRQLGISLPHFTGYQWVLGERIAKEDLAPGDIVFFYPQSYGPGHEGLYIGGGKFVHAPSTGDVVKISSLSEPGYAFGYMGAVRPY